MHLSPPVRKLQNVFISKSDKGKFLVRSNAASWQCLSDEFSFECIVTIKIIIEQQRWIGKMMTMTRSAYPNLTANVEYTNCRHFDDCLTQFSGPVISEVPTDKHISTKHYYWQRNSVRIRCNLQNSFNNKLTRNISYLAEHEQIPDWWPHSSTTK